MENKYKYWFVNKAKKDIGTIDQKWPTTPVLHVVVSFASQT